MYPQQNYTPNNQNDYEFIVNPQQAPKKKLIGGSSVAVRIGVVLGLIVILLIAFVVIRNVLSSGSSNQTALVAVLSEQKELIRLATDVQKKGAPLNNKTRNVAITTELSISSAKNELVKYLAKSGQKIDAKKILNPSSSFNDSQLKAAMASGNYDATVNDVLRTQLTSYQADLKTAFNKTPGPVGRELLNRQYDAAGLILKQLTPTP